MSKVQTTQTLLPQNENEGQSSHIYNWCSQFFFTWIYPILHIGKKEPLNQAHIHQFSLNQQAKASYKKFYSNFVENIERQRSLVNLLFLAFRNQIIMCFLFYVLSVALLLCSPFITKKSQEFFIYENEDDKPTLSSMFLFVILQLAYMLLLSLVKPFTYFQQSILSIKIQGALQQQIITKTLRFPISRSQHYSAGELINMLQVDITQASNYFTFFYILLMFPITLIVAGLVFYMTLGKEALIPAIGTLIQTIMGLAFGYYYGRIQKRYMESKDKRMKSVDEALIFTKQVKLNCLEEYFEKRIDINRNDELKYLKYQVYMLILIIFLQGIVDIATKEAWFFWAERLNFGIVTIMMHNYANIAMLLQELPNQFKNYSMSQNSVNRIANYFRQDDTIQLQLLLDENNNNAIEFESGVFDWKSNDQLENDGIFEEDKNTFQITTDVKIKKGQFVAFVGNSASGKSTILRSILGETNCKQGKISVHGTVSVAMQEPWIISGSIKENITFMNQFDQRKYERIIALSGLARDLRQFKYGDETILGEKGDNLSGGQQKRINLARAIYNDADIYLLDDPLSALDIKVQYQIHQQCFKDYLKDKTRILFTNSLANLQNCDQIFLVEKGRITRQGTFAEIKNINSTDLEQKQYIDTTFEEQHYPLEGSDKQDQKASLIQVEDQRKGTISKFVLQQIYTYLGGYVALLVAVIYFFVILGCQIIGNGIMASEGISDEEFRSIAIVAFLFIQLPATIVIITLKSYFLYRGLMTSKILHQKVMNNLLNASFTKFYNTILIGRLMNRLSKDVYNIDLLFPNEVYNLTSWITALLLPLIACYLYLNYIALPIVLVFFAFLLYLTIIYYRCLREVTRIESVSKSPVFTFFQQIVRGVSYVRACLKQDKIVSKQRENVDIDLGNQICLNGFQYWYQSLTGTITNFFQAILFIICFLFPGKTQKMTNMVLSQMQTVSQLILNATVSYGNIQMYSISFERCLHLMNDIEIEERNHSFITPNGNTNNKQSENVIALTFDKCSFQYRPNSKCILQDLSFSIKKGEKIGVVGRTGAGKSSIILALTQMIEQIDGSISIVGKNMNEFSISELRSQYSIIPQDPLVYMGSLQDNLDPCHKYKQQELIDACNKCKLFDLQSFKQLELQSEISVQGNNLSQGEKQLLNIARCLLDRKEILLIDEATASIDGPTEELINQIFQQCFTNHTMLTIAHKVTTIMNSDRIMVLDDGKIIEFDSPKKLIADDKSEFKQIIELIKQSQLL